MPVEVDGPSRLSRCRLWELVGAYYEAKGAEAWSLDVPSFITSNSFTANGYAKIVYGYLRDLVSLRQRGRAEVIHPPATHHTLNLPTCSVANPVRQPGSAVVLSIRIRLSISSKWPVGREHSLTSFSLRSSGASRGLRAPC